MSGQIPPEMANWSGGTKYEVRGTLGQGAMGVVLDAFDRAIERRVAIKIVRKPPADDVEGQESVARFKREAQAAGRLSHPHIVGVYDYGEDERIAWIVMEMVTGGSLKNILDRDERIPLKEVVRLTGEVLDALSYAHARKIVHRDIKPANVMLSEEGRAKLADFGIARIENSAMTQAGTLMGTPSYMAPEQFRGEPVDARADIWATGVMLYQLLTNEKPFSGGLSAVMHKVLNTEPVPPSALSSQTPRALDAVVMRALAKRPDERWPDAKSFAAAITAAMELPVVAGPAPAPSPADLDDATLVSGPPPIVLKGDSPPPVPPPAKPAPAGRPGWLLPVAGGGGLAVAGVLGFLLWPAGQAPTPAPTPTGPTLVTPTTPTVTTATDRPATDPAPATLAAGPNADPAPGPLASLVNPPATPATPGPATPGPTIPVPPATALPPGPTTPGPQITSPSTTPPGPATPATPGPGPQVTSPSTPATPSTDPRPGPQIASPTPNLPASPATDPRPGPQANLPVTPTTPGPRPNPTATTPTPPTNPQTTAPSTPSLNPPPTSPTAPTNPQIAAPSLTPGTPTVPATPQVTGPGPTLPPVPTTPPANPQVTVPATPPANSQIAAPPMTPVRPTTPGTPVTTPPTTPLVTPEPPKAPPNQQLAANALRPDFRAALAAAMAAAPCGLLAARADDAGLDIQGVLPRAEAGRVRATLADRNLPSDSARLDLASFDGPYCSVFPALRIALAEPGAAPRIALDGTPPLRDGQLLRMGVTMPDWATHLHAAFLGSDGTAVVLERASVHPRGARVRLGDPGPNFTGWEIGRPFGTDLVVVIASEGPIFPVDLPEEQTHAAYAAAVTAAVEGARRSNRRVALRPVVVETAP